MFRKSLITAASALLATTIALGAQPATAAKTKSCTRDGAKVVAASGDMRVVKLKSKLLGCTASTGKRFTVGDDVGDREFVYEFLERRYIGVRQYESGEVGLASEGRLYHAKAGKLASHTGECGSFSIGDDIGPDNFVFLYGGGIAMTCDKLVLVRKAGAAAETIEPAGTKVSRLAVNSNPMFAPQTLYWTVTKDGQDTIKSLKLS